jgi:hypothetical protein
MPQTRTQSHAPTNRGAVSLALCVVTLGTTALRSVALVLSILLALAAPLASSGAPQQTLAPR